MITTQNTKFQIFNTLVSEVLTQKLVFELNFVWQVVVKAARFKQFLISILYLCYEDGIPNPIILYAYLEEI